MVIRQLINDIKKVISTINGNFVIKLRSITHVIVENSYNVFDKLLKTIGFDILKKDDLLNEMSSSFIFVIKKDDDIFIKPVVYVRDILIHFFLETACW